jgi:hypothetical protein
VSIPFPSVSVRRGGIRFGDNLTAPAPTPRVPWWRRQYRVRSVTLYLDSSDVWVGYRRGASCHYVCPLPCVVLRRWRRRGFVDEDELEW